MSKFDLIIFDANVIIYLAKNGRLENLFNRCNVYLTETIYNEIKFWEDENGLKHTINLEEYKKQERLIIINNVDIDEYVLIQKVKAENMGLVTVDDGELEGIMFINQNRNYKMCTADVGAIKFLCVLGLSDNLISLEEILGNVNEEFSQEKLESAIKKGKELYIKYFFTKAREYVPWWA